MRTARWQHIDRHPREPLRPEPESAPSPSEQPAGQLAPPETSDGPVPAAFRAARGYFALRQYRACADGLLAALEELETVPGTYRLLGLALGRAEDPAGAVRALVTAVEREPDDAGLQASLLSARIQAGEVPAALTGSGAGPLGELAGAGAWLRGQALLDRGRFAEAAAEFMDAGRLFRSCSPSEEAAERIAAAYVGETVSRLLAGHLEAAQQGFSRLAAPAEGPPTPPAGARPAALTRALVDFARRLYEVVDAVRDLPPHERQAELAPLADLLHRARLRVRFYDGVQPVAMRWEGLL